MNDAVLMILALLVACEADDDHRSDSVRLRYPVALPHHDPAVIAAAEDRLGIELIVSDDNPIGQSILMIEVGKPHGGYGGATEFVSIDPPCFPIVWAVDNDFILAHELGHALGLHHVDDDDNLMSPDHEGLGLLTDDQVDTMRHFAWRYEHDCG